MKKDVRHVIRKRLSVAPQALKYMINVDVIFHKPLDDIITDPPAPFRSDGPTILGRYDIAIPYPLYISTCIHRLEASINSYTENGSGWRFKKVCRAEIKLMQYEPVVGNKFLPLPPYIAKKQAVINIKNCYDLHHILQNLRDSFTSVMANSREKFLCAQIQHETERTEDPLNAPKFNYIDSLAF